MLNPEVNDLIERVIENNIEKIFKAFRKAITVEINKLRINYNFAFKCYLTNAYQKYSKIKTLLYRTEPKFIYDFFECNKLLYGKNEIGGDDVNNILNISNYIIIQGTGGIGKTTLLKHFFINELSKNDLIPIFVELRNLEYDDKNSIRKCINNALRSLGFNLDDEYIEYAFKTGCFLVLLDGYDEIIQNKQQNILSEIGNFCDKYNENYYIISSRPSETFIALQRFTVLETLPFSKEQAYRMIEKLDYGDKEIKEKFLHELRTTLYNHYESFASNPLLLTIMLLTYDNYANIPEKVHIFYENAFETLYSRHDATKGGYKREIACGLSYDKFKTVFSKFCFFTYIKNKYEFTNQDLLEYLKETKKNIGFEFDIILYIKDLIDAICVLHLDGNTYIFSHRSFQEYFTANFLKDLTDEKQKKASLKLILDDRFLHDGVFDMLYDMEGERFENNIVIPILDEYEQKIDNNNERFSELLKLIIKEFGFRENGETIWFQSNKETFIFNYIRREYFETVYQYSELHYPKMVLEELKSNKSEIIYTSEEIIKSPELLNYFRESWIGKTIQIISNLLSDLLKKQRKIEDELDDILS